MSEHKNTTRELIMASALYTGGSILGPLIIFGGVGWYADRIFDTRPLMLLIFVGIAFVVTNVLLFRKARTLNAMMDRYAQEVKDKKESNEHGT